MQNSLFDFPTYSINKKIRLIELFGGIGTQAMALRDLGADFENYRLGEIDKHAVIQAGGKCNCEAGFNGYFLTVKYKGCKTLERYDGNRKA